VNIEITGTSVWPRLYVSYIFLFSILTLPSLVSVTSIGIGYRRVLMTSGTF